MRFIVEMASPPIECTLKKILPLSTLLLFTLVAALTASEALHVSPSPGTVSTGSTTVKTVSLDQALNSGAKEIVLHAGTYYLDNPIVLDARHSGLTLSAAPGESVIISGGMRLDLQWTPYRNGIMQAKTAPGLVLDQLFINGERLPMARYPNFDPKADKFGGTAADAISPERVARWADPAGGYIHAMHRSLWGDMSWRILGKNPDGTLQYEGGWQNNRPSEMHKEFRFVENIMEELDAPGEWFHDSKNATLYFMPPKGLNLKTAVVEGVRLRELIELKGTKENPVKGVTIRGLTFRQVARTFMENREPMLRSDWTIYRGGALFINGTEDATVENCDFDQVGGNTIFVNNYNRRVTIRGCLIRKSGANGIAFVGDPKAVRNPLFNYGEHHTFGQIDLTPGPQTDNFPSDCLVDDCVIAQIGRFEKQTAGVEIDMARNITVKHCSIYDVPRAGINIGDGCWGGNVIEFCDVFDTVKETSDHGAFNAWGRDRYWKLKDAPDKDLPALALLDTVQPNTLRNSRWQCFNGYDIDLDDGSSNYRIYNNLMLCGGLKLREGYHRVATNNIIINDNLHPHCWFDNSDDVFKGNIVMGPYHPAGGITKSKWGKEVDFNFFTTTDTDRTKYAANGCDTNSLVGDPQFVNAATGDFRVKESSPALKLGFVNFPMDQFGVQSPRLKAIARTPDINLKKTVKPKEKEASTPKAFQWGDMTVRELAGDEFSAYGVAADDHGVLVTSLSKQSAAYQAGLRKNDYIEKVQGIDVVGVKGFLLLVGNATATQELKFKLTREQEPLEITLNNHSAK
jgi:hypothetical protein